MRRILLITLTALLAVTATTAKEAYAVYNDGTLTFFYDDQKSSRNGTKYELNTGAHIPGWYIDHREDIKRAIFTPSFADARPTSTYAWFSLKNNSETSLLSEITGMKNLNTSEVTNTKFMFGYCSNLTSLDMSYFNTSKVTDMRYMFYRCNSLTSLNLCRFNTSKVENMESMFAYCKELAIIYVGGGWTTRNVTSSDNMFSGCYHLIGGAGTAYTSNHVDATYAHIDGGTVNPGYLADSSIEPYAVYTNDGTLTFYCDKQKGQRSGTKYCMNAENSSPEWYNDHRKDIKKVVFMPSFADARPTSTHGWFSMGNSNEKSVLSEITGLEYLNTTAVTDMHAMFFGCSSLSKLDVSHFDTHNVKSMVFMFYGCSGLTSIDVSHFDTEKVTNMRSMFDGCSGLKNLDLSSFCTTNVTDMGSMFFGCCELESLDLSQFDTDNVINMQAFFMGCSSLVGLDLNHFNTGKVTTMAIMFAGCNGLKSLDVSNFDTNNVTTMSGMFEACSGLTNLDLGNFDTSNVLDMECMFSGCSELTNLGLSRLNISNVRRMGGMFASCSSLKSLDLRNFDTNNVLQLSTERRLGIFQNCTNLSTIYVREGWNTKKVTWSDNMFKDCVSLVGGAGTKYDANHVDVEYAHIDGGPSNPGYLSKQIEVSDADDLQEFINQLGSNVGTENCPVSVPLDSSGMDVDGDVNIDKEVHLLFDGGANTNTPLRMKFRNGYISLKDTSCSLAFNNIQMFLGILWPNEGTSFYSGGIVNSGKLLLTGCTVGNELITNCGSMFINGETEVLGMQSKLGGRIYITSAMSKDVRVSISKDDIETGTPVISGGNGYVLTEEDAKRISITLPDAYKWKYDDGEHAIVIKKKGDSNDDDVIDVADIATIISYMSGDLDGIEQKQVDVNGDGVVDVADIATVISIMAGN